MKPIDITRIERADIVRAFAATDTALDELAIVGCQAARGLVEPREALDVLDAAVREVDRLTWLVRIAAAQNSQEAA